ncbi:unnamed protein product [Adineta steineri]|uniref:Gag-like protein n=1 Tax=Adineta steineri TaxID=433720 RepID=A0A815YEE6_9BILA|nr:unnamed protein product [Adineta steineri]CAF1569669.1 unnamed protein product [Adineta steineri]
MGRTSSNSLSKRKKDTCNNNQLNHIIGSTAEIYKQAYQNLMNIENSNDNTHSSTQVPFQYSIPPPTRNNLKPVISPVNSPARRPHPPSENGLSDLDDFELDPNTKTACNNRKKTKNNNINNVNYQHGNKSPVTSSADQILLNLQNTTVTTRTTSAANPAPSMSLHNQEPNINSSNIIMITNEAKSFAQSRYPFPPFILRFTTTLINEQKIADELCKFFKDKKQLELELIGYRKSSTKCSSNECDLLLFVKNSRSFSMLFDKNNWPQSILGLTFTQPTTPSIPPQLSLILKNVNLSINFTEFTNEIKSTYQNVHNVIRMKNMNQTNIKLVKLEFSDHKQRDEILNSGKIFINSISYDVVEYLAPAKVLICSKCMGIGHFRNQCKEEKDTCKKCGMTVDDIVSHTTTCSQLRCKHCNGNHMSNDTKCPSVKQFRASLTKYLLAPAMLANPQLNNGTLSTANFPPLNPSQSSSTYKQHDPTHLTTLSNPYHWSNNTATSNSLANKIDDLINSMNQVNRVLEKMVNKNDQFEQFMNDKKINDELVSNKIDELIKNDNNIRLITAQHEIKITRHENIFMKLVIPVLEEISSFLSNINVGKKGDTLDADFNSTIKRIRAQLNNAKTSKEY